MVLAATPGLPTSLEGGIVVSPLTKHALKELAQFIGGVVGVPVVVVALYLLLNGGR